MKNSHLVHQRHAAVQLSTEPHTRGQVLAVALGGAPIVAPIAGRVADLFGPRWSRAIGCFAGLAAAITGLAH